MFTILFWRGLLERAIKTFCQGFVYGTGLSITVTSISDGTGIAFLDVPWILGLQSGAILAIFSAVTSIGNADFTAGKDQPDRPAAPVGNAYMGIPDARPAVDPVNHPAAEIDGPDHRAG